jgi:3-deoxy-D-manno-octulosonate 8-phosphate phosphatase (KDO 8-P phosphatase)
MSNYKSLLRNIKAFAFDVDGVLTDGGVISMPDGDLCELIMPVTAMPYVWR